MRPSKDGDAINGDGEAGRRSRLLSHFLRTLVLVRKLLNTPGSTIVTVNMGIMPVCLGKLQASGCFFGQCFPLT